MQKNDRKDNRKDRDKKSYTLKSRLRYWFDRLMEKGTPALIGMLCLMTGAAVIVTALLSTWITGRSFFYTLWRSFIHTLSPGVLASDTGEVENLVLMVFITLFGIVFTSMLIGLLSSGIQNQLTQLKKGTSNIAESGHVVVLGFSAGIYTILRELMLANEDRKKKRSIVVMDDYYDNEVMRDKIMKNLSGGGKNRIVCRSGSISDFSDLKVCSLQTCSSIIINGSDDAETIRSVLAVAYLLKKYDRKDAYLVAVIEDRENLEAAEIAGGGYAEILHFSNIMARIIAHTTRNTGLSSVYSEIFGYRGSEFYLERFPRLAGKRMDELNRYFPVSVAVGIRHQGRILLNPPEDTLVQKGDDILLLAYGQGTSQPLTKPAVVDEEKIVHKGTLHQENFRVLLILGYNSKLPQIIEEEDHYLTKGSEIYVAVTEEQAREAQMLSSLFLENSTVSVRVTDIFRKKRLAALLDIHPFSVLVLAQNDEDYRREEESVADQKSLMLLLQLRALAKERKQHFSVTCEMQKVENQRLAQVAKTSDFIVSRNITSRILTQVAQTRELRKVFSELISEKGSEIYMRHPEDFVALHVPVDMYTAGAAVAAHHSVLIGVRIQQPDGTVKVCINPPKSQTYAFRPQDRLIVIAVD